MKREGRKIPEALTDDQRMLETVREMLGSWKAPGARAQAGAYAKEIIDGLHEEAKLALENPQAWREALLDCMEEEQLSEHAAALAYLAQQLYTDGGGITARLERLTDGRTASRTGATAVVERFESTPMEGMFACGQSRFPCLEDGEVRRLGVLLSAACYEKWHSEQRNGRPLALEALSMGAMAVWSFGVSALMCAAKENKPEDYARAVSMVALGNLSLALRFDSWAVLARCLESMIKNRELFFETLFSLCRALELERVREGHVLVSDALKEDYDEAAWTQALEDCLKDAQESDKESEEESEKESAKESVRESDEQWEDDLEDEDE